MALTDELGDRIPALGLALTPEQRRFDALIGVGGIGSGVFFAMDSNSTLGREESRGGRYLNRRDYCKLHIIAHYVQVLLGEDFRTFPIGKVGDDAAGKQLISEIAGVGMDTRYLEVVDGGSTLRSFCFVYPDGSGGNLTTSDSVLSTVDPAFVARSATTFTQYAERGIALAAPEVGLQARQRLIEMGSANGFFCTAALTSAEVQSDVAQQILRRAHLVSLNHDEASALVEMTGTEADPASVARAACDRLSRINPSLWVAVTAGRAGSWVWGGSALHHYPAIEANVASTAGAGDAFLAGLLVGITARLSLGDAQALATLLASFSVTSPHTIHPDLDRRSLSAFAARLNVVLPVPLSILLNADV